MLLTLYFLALMVPVAAVMIFSMVPSGMERVLVDRIAEIRNPRRSLRGETDGEELEREEDRTLDRRLAAILAQYSFYRALERLLLEADSPGRAAPLLSNSALLLAGVGALTFLFFHTFVWAAIAAGTAAFLPYLRLRLKRARRLSAATTALPPTADLLARALRAGHSMTQAIEALGEQAPPPLRAEFARVFQQQKLGVPLRDVLLTLGRRLPSRDLKFLITAILVQRETGGDLADILDRTSFVLQERIRVQGEVRVHTAQGRLTGWILSLLPVLLLGAICLTSPGYAHVLFVDPVGRKLLYAAVGFILLGAFVIARIVRVDF